MRSVSPVSPVDAALERVDGEGSWLLQEMNTSVKEHLAEATIQVCHFDSVRAFVTPVEVLAHPINCEPVRILQSGKIDHLGLWILANLAQLAET